MPGRIFRVTALLFYVLAGPVAPAWAQQEKAVTWLGLDWVYRSFDNGLGMAGYTLTAEDLSALSAGGASGTREARTREARTVRTSPWPRRTAQGMRFTLS